MLIFHHSKNILINLHETKQFYANIIKLSSVMLFASMQYNEAYSRYKSLLFTLTFEWVTSFVIMPKIPFNNDALMYL